MAGSAISAGVPRAVRLAALDAVLPALACPVCTAGLARAQNSLACPAGHRFDIARPGHVNLLGRPTPPHADTPAMVAAREAFLGSGAYAPIAEAVADALVGITPGLVADLGAGPGWYVQQVVDRLGAGLAALALDISPAACRRAAARGLAAVVTDTWGRLPLQDACLDAAMTIFAPRHPAELARVLRPGGRFILVAPQPGHLAGLRQRFGLLGIHPGSASRALAALDDAGLDILGVQALAFDVDCSTAQVAALIEMGPNAFHSHRLPDSPATADVRVEVALCRRRPNP